MRERTLLVERKFGPLFTTQFLGAFNDNVFKNCLVLLMTFSNVQVWGLSSKMMVPLAGALMILPFFLFSSHAGQLADKFEKSQLIRSTKLLEIVIMLVAAWGFYNHNYALLMILLFFMGAQSTLFGPLKYSILPQHLSEDELVAGNALIETGTFLAILLGTITGGVLAAAATTYEWFIPFSLVFIALLGWCASCFIPRAESEATQLKIQFNPILPVLETMKVARDTPSLMRSVLGISWFWFVGMVILSVFPDYSRDVLKGDSHTATFLLALFSIGIGLGSILCEKCSRDRLELGLVPLGALGMTGFLVDLYFSAVPEFVVHRQLEGVHILDFFIHSEGWHLIIAFLGVAVFGGFYIVPLYTLIQERSQPAIRSRLIATNNIINAIFMILGAVLLMGLFKLNFSVGEIFLVLAILNVMVALYIFTLIPEFLLRFIVWMISVAMYRIQVVGHEHVPRQGPAIIAANHVSFVDWIILAAAIRRPVRFVMWYQFAKGPMKFLVKWAKIIPIAGIKEDERIYHNAFKQISEELKKGQLICLFPEGGLTRDGHLQEFKPGIIKILQNDPVPVVPVVIKGMWESMFSYNRVSFFQKVRKKEFWRRVEVFIDVPMAPQDFSLEELKKRMSRLLDSRGSQN